MSAVDLVFDWGQPAPRDLVFGETAAPAKPVTFSAALQGPGFAGSVVRCKPVSIAVPLGAPGVAVAARYRTDTARPTVGRAAATWTEADRSETGAQAAHRLAGALPAGVQGRHQQAAPLPAEAAVLSHDVAVRTQAAAGGRSERAQAAPSGRRLVWQTAGMQSRRAAAASWQATAAVGTARLAPWQERLRDRRPSLLGAWGTAQALRRSQRGAAGSGAPLPPLGWADPWQEAMRPPAGRWTPVAPPVVPPNARSPHLVFEARRPASVHLVFNDSISGGPPPPTATVVIPVRGVYIMNNSVTLRVVATNAMLPVVDFRLQTDSDSWTWSFSATLPLSSASALQPTGGAPVEVEVMVNGVPYRLIAERLATARTFEGQSLQVSGRGLNAVLADPYADRRSFSSASAATAQQLMEAALTDNGVPIGWSVAFGLDDWLIPADTWAHQGTWLTAVRTIAEAAGGYVQPHNTDQVLRILPRYPAAPWDWAGLTPDFELPSSIVSVEAMEWLDKPTYNRVFVVGERNGLTVRVSRAGTAGDAVAPSVVDPLITAVAAGRQRGRAVLSDVGRQAALQISLPVLSELGVIPPGALVRYLDGTTTRLGLVRTSALSAGVQMRQTLGIETHVAP